MLSLLNLISIGDIKVLPTGFKINVALRRREGMTTSTYPLRRLRNTMVNLGHTQGSLLLPITHRWVCLNPAVITRPLSLEVTALPVSLPLWMITISGHLLVGVLHTAPLRRLFLEQDGLAPSHSSSML